jgi:hypothetical protein
VANVNGPDDQENYGKIVAAYVVAEAGSQADVAMFNIPDFPVLVPFQTGFEAEYKALCPECGYQSTDLSVDALARDLSGGDPQETEELLFPAQILTQETVEGEDPESFNQIPDEESVFKKLWKR